MSASDAAARGQRLAGSLMADAVAVTRVTGRSLGEDTGRLAETGAAVWSGPARLRPAASDSTRVAGERADSVRSYVVSLPLTATAVLPGDRVTVTSSLDTALTGAVLTVQGQAEGTHLTARRLACELVEG